MNNQTHAGPNENTLDLYNTFMHNLGLDEPLEDLIEKNLDKGHAFRVLDIGCGNAGALRDLKHRFDKRVHTIGVDLQTPALLPDEFIQADAARSPLPANLGLIVSFRALHEIGHVQTILRQTAAALAPRGRAILAIRTNRETFGGTVEREPNLSHADTEFLAHLSDQTLFDNARVLCTPFFTHSLGTHISVPAGYLVLLFRSV